MSRDELMDLQDIANSCTKVLQYTESLTQADLVRDQKCCDAVVRNLEIIGEAAKHISEDLRARVPVGRPGSFAHRHRFADRTIHRDPRENAGCASIPPCGSSGISRVQAVRLPLAGASRMRRTAREMLQKPIAPAAMPELRKRTKGLTSRHPYVMPFRCF